MTAARAFAVATLIAIACTSVTACVGDCAPQVRDGWVRLLPMPMSMTAGFGRIENRCATPVTIIGVSSPAFGDVSLHETHIVASVSRMRAVPELRIAADSVATLQPGGLHLMLMQPRAPLTPGSRVLVEFALKDGGTLRGELVVRKPGE